MPDSPPPGIYLATPRTCVAEDFCVALEPVLQGFDIACLRITTAASEDERELLLSAARISEVARRCDVPVVLETHYRIARRLELDGVHLSDGPRHVREARKALGPGAIVGAHCGASRHAGIGAAETGCDYVSFGPVGKSQLLGDGANAGKELFAWWQEMIEIPVVAEGALTPQLASDLRQSIDFLCLGSEIWAHPDGAEKALTEYLERLR
ncbi:MAG: thiamine phosphate synthase [Paracoccaceae bacterium]